MKSKIDLYVEELIESLLKLGFVVHRYKAYSSNSYYIKLDYGYSRSIRISDHISHKKHLSYAYNVLFDCDLPEKTGDRIYIKPEETDLLLDFIKWDRTTRMNNLVVFKAGMKIAKKSNKKLLSRFKRCIE